MIRLNLVSQSEAQTADNDYTFGSMAALYLYDKRLKRTKYM